MGLRTGTSSQENNTTNTMTEEDEKGWMNWVRDDEGTVIGVSAEFAVTREEAAKRWPEAYAKFVKTHPV